METFTGLAPEKASRIGYLATGIGVTAGY